jgi:hypothetical protein
MGVEPASRERVFGLMEEWNEMLSGRPAPTKD